MFGIWLGVATKYICTTVGRFPFVPGNMIWLGGVVADAMVFFSCSFLAKILTVSERASASYLGVNCPCGVGAHFIFLFLRRRRGFVHVL